MPGYWQNAYWPVGNEYFPDSYWPEYREVVYELLITAGYWPTTYFPACYWVNDYWPEYGAPTGFAYSQCVIIG